MMIHTFGNLINTILLIIFDYINLFIKNIYSIISENMPFLIELIRFSTAILSLFVLLIGINLIKDYRLRRFDAMCGFLPRLKMNIIKLKELSQIEEDVNGYIDAKNSAFLHLAQNATYIYVIKNSKGYYFTKDRMFLFVQQTQKTLDLFVNSDAQIPLSKKMQLNFNLLISNLQKIIFHWPENEENGVRRTPYGDINSSTIIKEYHKEFIDILQNIIDEIEEITPYIFKDFWKEVKKLSKKNKKCKKNNQKTNKFIRYRKTFSLP